MIDIPPVEPPQEPLLEKPKRKWRTFLLEFGTIVLGVSVALAAQQAAEWLNNRAKAAEARAGIREEIARNLGRMNARQVVEACIGKRMDEVDGLIAASAAGRLPQETIWIGTPPSFNTFDSTYRAAMQSGTAGLFGYSEQRDYANLYSAFEIYNRAGQEEQQSWSDLRTLEKHPAPSATLDWQLRSAMQQARLTRYSIDNMRYFALRDAAGVGVTPAQQAQLRMSSVCVPLHTPRDEAVKLMERARGRQQPVP